MVGLKLARLRAALQDHFDTRRVRLGADGSVRAWVDPLNGSPAGWIPTGWRWFASRWRCGAVRDLDGVWPYQCRSLVAIVIP